MDRNLKIFIGLTFLLTIGLILVSKLVDNLPPETQTFGAIVQIALFFWVAFSLIVRIIYRLAGVTGPETKIISGKLPARLTHQQVEAVGRYWIAWLITSITTMGLYTLLFARSQWKSTLFIAVLVVAAVAVSSIGRRQKMMGHTKKELFK